VWSGYAPLRLALPLGGSAEGARSAAEGAPIGQAPAGGCCRRQCRRRGAAPLVVLLCKILSKNVEKSTKSRTVFQKNITKAATRPRPLPALCMPSMQRERWFFSLGIGQ
jgi:hypothetical protein